MDEKTEEEQPLTVSNQYPKEAVKRRQNSSRGSRGSDSSRTSRKSFRLDYRLEEDVTKSKRGKDGRFVNPWPTWKSPTFPNVLKWSLMEKNNSNVPCSKQVNTCMLPVLDWRCLYPCSNQWNRTVSNTFWRILQVLFFWLYYHFIFSRRLANTFCLSNFLPPFLLVPHLLIYAAQFIFTETAKMPPSSMTKLEIFHSVFSKGLTLFVCILGDLLVKQGIWSALWSGKQCYTWWLEG